MDNKNNQILSQALVIKLVLILLFLLTLAFVLGIAIGKNGKCTLDRTSADEDEIQEKLAGCIFNSDEMRGKYLKLRDAAREKGLLDENDAVNPRVICNSMEQKPAETKPAEKTVETSPETSPQEKQEPAAEKPEPVESKHEKTVERPQPVEKNIETKPEKTKPAEKPAEPKPAESKKPDKNKTIDEILAEKNVTPKKEVSKKDDIKKCRFSIQIFAANTKEQADAAAKKLKSLKPRIVSGENNGKKWYKLRTGCFDSREAAEAELPKVKKSEKSAYIVSE